MRMVLLSCWDRIIKLHGHRALPMPCVDTALCNIMEVFKSIGNAALPFWVQITIVCSFLVKLLGLILQGMVGFLAPHLWCSGGVVQVVNKQERLDIASVKLHKHMWEEVAMGLPSLQ
jgi:hypothetical protein